MKNILNKIYNGKFLNYQESFQLFDTIAQEKLKKTQIIAILAIIASRKKKSEEIFGAHQASIKYIKKFPRPNYTFYDIVGTGGDKKNSFSISTVSAIIAASYGLKISKICNFSSSGKFGSADLLEDLKINTNISSKKSRIMLDKYNICFLLANKYLNIYQNLSKIRKDLDIKTIFNIIGPLLNPSYPKNALIGVYDSKLMLLLAKILKKLKYKHVIIVNSGGTDEITLHFYTKVVELKDNKIIIYKLKPKDFGLKKQKNPFIFQKNRKENFSETIKLFQGYGNSIYVDTIAMNVALLLKMNGENNLIKNTQCIIELINSGKVYFFLKKLSEFTQINKKK